MSAFVLNYNASLRELAEQARIRAYQTYALSESINDLASSHEDLKDYQRFHTTTHLLWLLADLLKQQTVLCEQLECTARRASQVSEVQG